jgi:hypothetical protein
MDTITFALQAGQAYCYTSNEPEEMEFIFFSAYSNNVAESTNSEEEESCCSHYEQHTVSNDTTAYCDYLDQLAQDLCDDIASIRDAIEQLCLDTETNPELVPVKRLHHNTVAALTTISENSNAAIEITSASTINRSPASTTSLIKQPDYHYRTIDNHCPRNRLHQKPPRLPKINTTRQKSYYILFATILICILQHLLYMPRKKTSTNMSTTSTNPSESSIRTR